VLFAVAELLVALFVSFLLVVMCLVVSASAIDYSQSLVSDTTCHVSTGMLNSSHSLTLVQYVCMCRMSLRNLLAVY